METAANLPLVGGDLAVDFVNSVAGHRRGKAVDRLRSHADLVAWGLHAGAIDARAARRHPRGGARELARAVALREAIHAVLVAVIEGRRPARADLDRISAEAAEAAAHQRLEQRGGRFGLAWDEPTVTRAVARAAAALLTGDRLHRLGRCASDTCGWLFLDTSKAGRRRWCEMGGCGSRAKARRYYRRRRRAKTKSASARPSQTGG